MRRCRVSLSRPAMIKPAQNGVAASNGNCKYSAAAQADREQYRELELDKSSRSCGQRCALTSCFLGLALILGGIVSAFIVKPFVTSQILAAMPLVEGEPAFLGWRDPPVTPLMTIYFFNLTNEAEFLAGRARPQVDKVGPYIYTEELHKVNVSFDETRERVTVSDNKTYFFSPARSAGAESDIVIVPNIPLFGVFRRMEGSWSSTKWAFEKYFDSFNFGIDKTPFLRDFSPPIISTTLTISICYSN